eukprot:TRINITY_DN45511_c0_g1_i1.p1 TRINITY_DN45511_c0_g1~~TRINITY_DN45511_c0_g1_i1.p1  ORF type:complete len:484 (+),score=73.16 TRINITY_DN45511_c0_g1_i1:106-1557(+)
MAEVDVEINGELRRVKLQAPSEALQAQKRAFTCIEDAIAREFGHVQLIHGSVKYIDDEGDLCTLSEHSFPDFWHLATTSAAWPEFRMRVVATATLLRVPSCERAAQLQVALASDDVQKVEAACKALEGTSDAEELLAEGRQRLKQLAEQKLLHAMQNPSDFDGLVCAMSMADHYAASPALIRQAGEMLAANRGSQESLALDLFAAATSKGSTWRHRVLAPLLSSILTQSSPVSLAALLDFVSTSSRAFSLTPQSYGNRGGKPYFKPVGWLRFSLRLPNFDSYKDWCIAYHGSKSQHVTSILAQGLQNPQRARQVSHGQVGGTGRTIYLSPSIEYAAHPIYCPLVELGPEHWAQLIIECRVAPRFFREQGRTLPPHTWPPELPFDVYYPLGAWLEWLVEDSSAIVVSGLMIREFGRGAQVDRTTYGEAACQVTHGPHGPGFDWSYRRIHELRSLLRTSRFPSVAGAWPWLHTQPELSAVEAVHG